MRIALCSIFVDDQEKALRFYTEVLGFVKKADVPVGAFRWLTVVAPEGAGDVELVLEPNDNPIARAYQKGLFQAGIPATSFAAANVEGEFERLRAKGVRFAREPTKAGPVTIAVFDDTCGNLMQIHED